MCGLTLEIKSNKFVCSAHFEESDFKRDLRMELMGVPTKRSLNADGKYFFFVANN